MDEFTDAWFVGFDPDITVGVWVGYDEKRPLGSGETGAQAALPIWMDYMRAYIGTRANRATPPRFEAPGNIVFVTLPNGITEAFINGTQPAGMTARPAGHAAGRGARFARRRPTPPCSGPSNSGWNGASPGSRSTRKATGWRFSTAATASTCATVRRSSTAPGS